MWVTGEPFTFAPWGSGEPSGGPENVMHYYNKANPTQKGSTWNDITDSFALTGYIVEFEP